jgi:hypothetical protein
MWPDDRFWLPHALAGKCVHGSFRFQGQDRIIGHELEVMTPAR